jgi:hypothetical protein
MIDNKHVSLVRFIGNLASLFYFDLFGSVWREEEEDEINLHESLIIPITSYLASTLPMTLLLNRSFPNLNHLFLHYHFNIMGCYNL